MTIIVLVLAVIGGGLLYEYRRLRVRLARMSRTAQGKHNAYQKLEKDRLGEVEARRQTEDKLRRYLRLMDAILNSIPTPVFFSGRAGGLPGLQQCFRPRRHGPYP